MRRAVVNLRDVRPVWALTDEAVARIRAAFPVGWDVRMVESETSGTGDGRWDLPLSVLEAVADAEVYMGFGIPAAVLRAGPRLRWVHSAAAGVRGSLTPELRARDLVFTNSAGIHAAPMAEWIIGALHHFARGFDLAVPGHREGRWDVDPFLRADTPVRELAGTTVGVVGFGGIGREVATRALALGMDVVALRRSARGHDLAAPAGRSLEVVSGEEGFDRVLSSSDHLVLCAPETPETQGMMDVRAFERLRAGAVLVNVSRGSLVDEPAMLEALRSGTLRGAALDVFEREPLPEGHPLWTTPHILMTPHVSGVSRRFWDRQADLIVENARRYVAGQELLNGVDPALGY